MSDKARDAARNPFAKNRDFYLSCICTIAEGLLGGANFVLIWMVMHQVFAGAVELAALLQITGMLVVVFAALAGPADDAPAPCWDPRPGSRPRGAVARKDPQAAASDP